MKKLTFLAILFLFILIGVSFTWNYASVKKSHQEMALQMSKSFFSVIVAVRAWNTGHGGVYVPVTEITKPNPYLEDPLRDLETNKGISLTKINPAYMTRQIGEILALENGVRFHITSLKPIRPKNKPTNWERQWLQEFEHGIQEKGMFVQQDSKHIFRYMAPLIALPSCLKCHAKHGYKEGDIRGGISITFPFPPKPNITLLILGYGIATIIGVVFILVLGFIVNTGRNKLLLVKASLEAEIKVRKTAESGWSAAMDVYDDALYLLDLNRHIIRANKTFYQMTDSSPDTAIGRHITEIVHPLGEKVPCPVCLAQEEKRDTVIIMEADHPDNPAGRPIEIIIKTVRDEQYQPISIFMSLHDLTNSRREIVEKQNLEEQLKRAQKMEAIGTLAGGVAHDFNNILAAILGYGELAKMELPANSPINTKLDCILQAGNRAKKLVKQILTFSHQTPHELQPLEVQLIVKEAITLLRASIPTTIEITQLISQDPGTVMADPTQIHQVIMNLCTNAYQSMREAGGVLTIGLNVTTVDLDQYNAKITELNLTPDPYVHLWVSDTGPGIDHATQERIFEPYFTTKGKGEGEGTGMGLAVVHGIVKNHDGHIIVDSKPGQWTTFHIYLPQIVDTSTPDVLEATALLSQANRERILVVDDDNVLVQMQQLILEGLGYHVTAITDCREALQIFCAKTDNFDLVITDMTMPHLTGIELAQKLMAARNDIPIILCTGFSEQVNEEQAKAMGIREYIMKPIPMVKLARVVKKVLDER